MPDRPIPRHTPSVPLGRDRLQRIIERGNARRRRRHRRVRGAQALAVAVVALMVAAGVVRINQHGGEGATQVNVAGPGTGPASSEAPPTSTLPAAGRVVRSGFGLAPNDTALLASWGSTLYAVVHQSGGTPDALTLRRIGAQGTTDANTLTPPLAPYLNSLSAGPDGLYAGTSVISKFSSSPDELLRFDTAKLSVSATKTFPAEVQPIAGSGGLWASIGDGRVVRLDPKTLAVLASVQVLPAATASQTTLDNALSRPALGLGSLWVLAGDENDLELVRMDPTSLDVLSRTKVPTSGDLRQQLGQVVADQGHVYVTGGAVAAVNANGTLARAPVAVPGLQPGAQIYGSGLVGVVDDPHSSSGAQPAVVLFNASGTILARTTLAEAGGPVVITGSIAWLRGDAGSGSGLVELQLASSPPSSQNTTRATTNPATTTTTSPPAPRCKNADLRISLAPGQGATGSWAVAIAFRNTSATTCSLDGFPGVSWVSASGEDLGEADHLDQRRLGSVNIEPGRSATAALMVPDGADLDEPACHHVEAAAIRVFAPGSRSSVLLHPSGQDPEAALKYSSCAASRGVGDGRPYVTRVQG